MISIVIAYKADNGLRTRQMKWTVNRYRKMFPSAEIILSEDKGSKKAGWDGFCKSKYINLGVKKATNETLLITDIDVVLPITSIIRSIKELDAYCCVIPYSEIYRLSFTESDRIMSMRTSSNMPVIKGKHKKVIIDNNRAQGICVIRKSTFEKVGGYDERFSGWGSEDSAFLKAAKTITGSTVLIHKGFAYHLKHPIVKDRHKLRDQNSGKYLDEYIKAEGNKELMEAIIRKR